MSNKPKKHDEDSPEAEGHPARSLHDRVTALVEWSSASRFRMAVTGVTVILSLGTFFALWSYLAHLAVTTEEPVTLEMALDALDVGDYEQADQIIRQMQRQPQNPDEFGGALYVLGAIKVNQAESEWSAARQRAVSLVAARYLQKAEVLGVPTELEPQLLFLLGQSLIRGNQPQQGIEPLKRALSLQDTPAKEIHALLTEANLTLPNPDLESVLYHSEELLSQDNLTDEEKTAALVLRAETLGNLGRAKAANQIVKDLRIQAPEDGKLRSLSGRLLLAEAMHLSTDNPKRPELIEQAQLDLHEAQRLDPFNGETTRQAKYWIGKSFEIEGKYDQAIKEFDQIGKLYGDTPESLAAMLAEADLLRFSGEKKRALAGYRHVLEAVDNPTTYSNKLMSLEELKKHLSSAHASFVESRDFDAAMTLLEQFPQLFNQEEIIALRAQTHERWGNELLRKAREATPLTAAKLSKQGRYHLRAAGRAYETLARVHFASREYSDDLWLAAENYFLGQSYSHAARVLEDYLQYEPERRNAAVLLRLGQSHLTTGRVDDAVRALENCITIHPRDLAVYQARLECVRAYRQLNRNEEAEQLLLENINGEELTPKSPEWRNSLFELGEIYHEAGRYVEAIEVLREAVQRDKDAPQALMARYTIARSYHIAAKKPAQNVLESKTENERQKNRKLRDEFLEGALENYKLVQRMMTLENYGEGSALRKNLLRNCYMMQGSVLFQLRRYEEASQAYANVSTLFQDEPFVLESFVHIANCWRRLDQPIKARGTIEQAKLVLQRLPKDIDFKVATNFNRQQWKLFLDEMSQW